MIMKVSSDTDSKQLAKAIASNLSKNSGLELQTIGAGALNQAVKACAIARGYLAPMSKELEFQAGFMDIEKDGEDRTAIKLTVKTREC